MPCAVSQAQAAAGRRPRRRSPSRIAATSAAARMSTVTTRASAAAGPCSQSERYGSGDVGHLDEQPITGPRPARPRCGHLVEVDPEVPAVLGHEPDGRRERHGRGCRGRWQREHNVRHNVPSAVSAVPPRGRAPHAAALTPVPERAVRSVVEVAKGRMIGHGSQLRCDQGPELPGVPAPVRVAYTRVGPRVVRTGPQKVRSCHPASPAVTRNTRYSPRSEADRQRLRWWPSGLGYKFEA